MISGNLSKPMTCSTPKPAFDVRQPFLASGPKLLSPGQPLDLSLVTTASAESDEFAEWMEARRALAPPRAEVDPGLAPCQSQKKPQAAASAA